MSDDTKTSNIVQFPRKPSTENLLPASMEEAYAMIRESRQMYIDESMEDIEGMIDSITMQLGFRVDTGNRLHMKTRFMMFHAIEAAMYAMADVPHDMHDHISAFVLFDDEKEALEAEAKAKKPRKTRKKKTPETPEQTAE